MDEELNVVSVQYEHGKRFDNMIFLRDKATLITADDERILCVGGVIFLDGLE